MCDCLQSINEALKERNTEIVYALDMANGGRVSGVYIQTQKVDSAKRHGGVKLLASYCPFCGCKYETGE